MTRSPSPPAGKRQPVKKPRRNRLRESDGRQFFPADQRRIGAQISGCIMLRQGGTCGDHSYRRQPSLSSLSPAGAFRRKREYFSSPEGFPFVESFFSGPDRGLYQRNGASGREPALQPASPRRRTGNKGLEGLRDYDTPV